MVLTRYRTAARLQNMTLVLGLFIIIIIIYTKVFFVQTDFIQISNPYILSLQRSNFQSGIKTFLADRRCFVIIYIYLTSICKNSVRSVQWFELCFDILLSYRPYRKLAFQQDDEELGFLQWARLRTTCYFSERSELFRLFYSYCRIQISLLKNFIYHSSFTVIYNF